MSQAIRATNAAVVRAANLSRKYCCPDHDQTNRHVEAAVGSPWRKCRTRQRRGVPTRPQPPQATVSHPFTRDRRTTGVGRSSRCWRGRALVGRGRPTRPFCPMDQHGCDASAVWGRGSAPAGLRMRRRPCRGRLPMQLPEPDLPASIAGTPAVWAAARSPRVSPAVRGSWIAKRPPRAKLRTGAAQPRSPPGDATVDVASPTDTPL